MKNNETTHSDLVNEAAQLQYNSAKTAIRNGNRSVAWNHLHQVLDRLNMQPMDSEGEVLYVSTSLDFSDLSFALGQGFKDSKEYLQTAVKIAQRLGDNRSSCLIKLHLGRLLYFGEKRAEAISMFETGKAEVDRLGDEDILSRAAEFIGLYYFIQGIIPEAKLHFEKATKSFESGEWTKTAVDPSGPMWLSYCYAYMGHFHEAIGTLDYYRRLALDRSDQSLAITFRSVLGIVLCMIKNIREAAFHLSGALQEAMACNNALAMYFAKGGLAYLHLLEGRFAECRDLGGESFQDGVKSGLVVQYSSPIIIEMIHDLSRKVEEHPTASYRSEYKRIMSEPNIHLRGVVLRLEAMDEADRKGDDELIASYLDQSEQYLIRSSDPVQLAKTWIEMARLNLRRGQEDKARTLAQKAWKGFSGYGDVFFPDDLRYLLAIKSDITLAHESPGGLLESFIDMIQELVPSSDMEELFRRTVIATNRILGAERGGIFWFGQHGGAKKPILRGYYNLSSTDVEAEEFSSNKALVFKAYKENKLQMVRQNASELWPYQTKAVLCVPIVVQGRVQGVLYHDNSYVKDCFGFFEETQLLRMAQYLTKYIENIFVFCQRVEQRAFESQQQLQGADPNEIIAESPPMLQLLGQTDRIAASDSTVLILGETGVGKELLAMRLHKKSQRHQHPFVIVDMTAIPETLFESELFGHEKGAFTSANKQKIGRMELAHRGTLFIDEIGETPKSIQAKLLRVLQEKTLYRVGGSKSISSDFRLVAATNRDLATEVAAGRFREDLYYRLNVVPLTLPPLRERKQDILLLAEYYLTRFSAKYTHQAMELTPQDQEKLMAYHWPGNVRELRNIIERAVLMWTGDSLSLDLPKNKTSALSDIFVNIPTLDEMQRRYIRQILNMTNGKIGGPGGAAEILGMKRTSLNNRMIKLGMSNNRT